MRNLISDSNTSKTADVVEMEKQNGSANELVNELRTVQNSYLHLQICPIDLVIYKVIIYKSRGELFEIWTGLEPATFESEFFRF